MSRLVRLPVVLLVVALAGCAPDPRAGAVPAGGGAAPAAVRTTSATAGTADVPPAAGTAATVTVTATSTVTVTAQPVPAAPSAAAPPAPAPVTAAAARPLAGLTIAVDPGHNPGNYRHPREINRKYWVGLWKACNTAGTATASGYSEAAYTWAVSVRLRARLEALGARVVLSRGESTPDYGPCIRDRGAFGVAQGAVLKVSVHADGAPAAERGFHVITPAALPAGTRPCLAHARPASMVPASRRLGTAMIAGMRAAGLPPATYVPGARTVRADQGTLNCSDIPTVIVETLNMRNAADAARARSAEGRDLVARGIVAGVRGYLGR